MTTQAFAPVSSACRLFRAAFWMAGLASLVTFGLPARAQVVIGGNTTPNVTIDYSVLEELGRAPNVPQVLSGQSPSAPLYPYEYRIQPRFPVIEGDGTIAGSNRIVLKPPAAPKPRTTRQKTSARGAKKPAAKQPADRKKSTTTARRTPRTGEGAATARPQSLTPPPPPTIAEAPASIVPPPPMAAPTLVPIPAPPRETVASLPPPPPAPPDPPPLPQASVAPAPPPGARPRTAAVTSRPEPAASPGSLRRIGFLPGSAKLDAAAATELKAMADAMNRDSALRVQLLAYAGQSSDSASQARRLSLSRALAARSQLIEQGVRSTRIDVRALGNKSEGGPADRIDVIVTKR